MSEPGNELADLLWHDGPALRTPPPPPPFFPPFASTSTPAHDVFKQPQLASTSASAALMRDLRDADADDGDRHDAVPWLHYPDVEAPPSLPTDYCSALLAGSPYAVDLPALRPAAVPAREMPASSHAAVVPTAPAPEHVPKQPRVSGGEGGVMNFTFFSKPLQRPPGHGRASTIPVESTAVQMQTSATNLLRSTPLFSEQRMAWLQPPRASASAPRSTVASAPPVDAALQRIETTATTTTPRLPPEAGAPELPAPATTSSVCSGSGGDRSQLKRRSGGAHQSAEWSVSQDEELEDDDDDGGGAALRRSAARGTKRTRTAHVHNQSERRRRDRINEKMRALQELIPNCNKIDKASMLEEAIEYLKTLQLQVQMMSMGTGICVPPMLMPAMQHLQMQMQVQMPMAAAHFASLGAMAGLGFGMPAAQFPCPPMFPAMFGVPSPVPSFPHASASSAAQTTPGGGAADSGDHPHVPVVVAQCDEIQMQRSDHT